MFAKSLLLAASVTNLALAAQEFGILNETGLTHVGDRLLQVEPKEKKIKLSCKVRAKKPGDTCYFRSNAYFAKSATDKIDELWRQILVDDEPMSYYWSEFPNIFT